MTGENRNNSVIRSNSFTVICPSGLKKPAEILGYPQNFSIFVSGDITNKYIIIPHKPKVSDFRTGRNLCNQLIPIIIYD